MNRHLIENSLTNQILLKKKETVALIAPLFQKNHLIHPQINGNYLDRSLQHRLFYIRECCYLHLLYLFNAHLLFTCNYAYLQV